SGPAVSDGEKTYGHVGDRGNRDRGPVSERRDEDIAGDSHAHHGSKGVHRVEDTSRTPEAGLLSREGLAQDWQRSTHQHRRDEQEREDNQKLDQAKDVVRRLERPKETQVERRGKTEERRNQRAIHTHANLEPPVGAYQIPNSRRAPAEDVASEAKPRHERSKHRGDRV